MGLQQLQREYNGHQTSEQSRRGDGKHPGRRGLGRRCSGGRGGTGGGAAERQRGQGTREEMTYLDFALVADELADAATVVEGALAVDL